MSSDACRDLVVVCYDIVDHERRKRVANLLEGFGQRVQCSVFEIYTDPVSLGGLRRRLAQEIDPLTDRVRIYRLCGKDARGRRRQGVGPVLSDLTYEVC